MPEKRPPSAAITPCAKSITWERALCPSGPEKHYVAYYPQGRMDLYRALAENLIPVTEALVDTADTCTSAASATNNATS